MVRGDPRGRHSTQMIFAASEPFQLMEKAAETRESVVVR